MLNLIGISMAQPSQIALPNYDADYMTIQLYFDDLPITNKLNAIKPNGGYIFVNCSIDISSLEDYTIKYLYDDACYNNDISQLKTGLNIRNIISEFAPCNTDKGTFLRCINEAMTKLKLISSYQSAVELYEYYTAIIESSSTSKFEVEKTKIAQDYLLDCIKYGFPKQGLKVEYYRNKIVKNYGYEIPLSEYIERYTIPNLQIEGAIGGMSFNEYKIIDYTNKLFYSTNKSHLPFYFKLNHFIGKPKVHWRKNYISSTFRRGPIAFSSFNDKLDSINLGLQFDQLDLRIGWLGRLSKDETRINKFIFGFSAEIGIQGILRSDYTIDGDSTLGLLSKTATKRMSFNGTRIPMSFGFVMGYNKILCRLALDFGSKVYLTKSNDLFKIKNFFGGTFSLSLPITYKAVPRYRIFNKSFIL
jgi:hypothetical protein